MKALLFTLLAILFFGCQKQISTPVETTEFAVISSDATAALALLPCHTVTFTTNYPIVAGQVPPFRFTKTLYPDTRVKTINMLSRVYPNYGTYKKWAYELIGTFTYGKNYMGGDAATFNGTRQTWEYYKATNGAAARRSIAKKTVRKIFWLNSRGFCTEVFDGSGSEDLAIEYGTAGKPDAITYLWVNDADGLANYNAVIDKYGNTTTYKLYTSTYSNYFPTVSYTYDYAIPRGTKKYSFIPSQNLFSEEFNLCEVMQWIPQPTHQRKSVSGTFYYGTAHTKIIQSQVYKNYKFDAKGNEISVTYADNILQKTTWFCK